MKTSFLNEQKLPLIFEAGENAERDFSLESLVSVCFGEGARRTPENKRKSLV